MKEGFNVKNGNSLKAIIFSISEGTPRGETLADEGLVFRSFSLPEIRKGKDG